MKQGEALQTSAPGSITVTAASTPLAALNPRRGQLLIWVPAAATAVYLALAGTASTTAYTLLLTPSSTAGAYYELPMAGGQVYIGPVSAVTASGSSTIMVTEISI